METKDAMKAVINASTARTENTFANTDLIQLYDNNGNPSFKISKSDFMSAVYNYLTSSSVAANLASVLGGVGFTRYDEAIDFNDITTPGVYQIIEAYMKVAENGPGTLIGGGFRFRVFKHNSTIIQIGVSASAQVAIRVYWDTRWSSWKSLWQEVG